MTSRFEQPDMQVAWPIFQQQLYELYCATDDHAKLAALRVVAHAAPRLLGRVINQSCWQGQPFPTVLVTGLLAFLPLRYSFTMAELNRAWHALITGFQHKAPPVTQIQRLAALPTHILPFAFYDQEPRKTRAHFLADGALVLVTPQGLWHMSAKEDPWYQPGYFWVPNQNQLRTRNVVLVARNRLVMYRPHLIEWVTFSDKGPPAWSLRQSLSGEWPLQDSRAKMVLTTDGRIVSWVREATMLRFVEICLVTGQTRTETLGQICAQHKPRACVYEQMVYGVISERCHNPVCIVQRCGGGPGVARLDPPQGRHGVLPLVFATLPGWAPVASTKLDCAASAHYIVIRTTRNLVICNASLTKHRRFKNDGGDIMRDVKRGHLCLSGPLPGKIQVCGSPPHDDDVTYQVDAVMMRMKW